MLPGNRPEPLPAHRPGGRILGFGASMDGCCRDSRPGLDSTIRLLYSLIYIYIYKYIDTDICTYALMTSNNGFYIYIYVYIYVCRDCMLYCIVCEIEHVASCITEPVFWGWLQISKFSTQRKVLTRVARSFFFYGLSTRILWVRPLNACRVLCCDRRSLCSNH